jgi:hypothetical protein
MSFHKMIYFLGEAAFTCACLYLNYKLLPIIGNFLDKRGLDSSGGGRRKEVKRLALGFSALILSFWLLGPIYKYQLFAERDEDGDLSGVPIALFLILPLTWGIYTPVALRLQLYDKKREKNE